MRVAVLVVLMAAWGCDGQGGRRPGVVGSRVDEVIRARGRARVVVALDGSAAGTTAFDDVTRRLEAGSFAAAHRLPEVAGLAGEVDAAGLEGLAADPAVERIELDPTAHALLAESAPLIRARDMQAVLGYTGRGVTVAVIDTGTDVTHPDLSDDIILEECFCTDCCPDGSSRQSGYGAALDDNGHGTNVAGIVSGAGNVAPPGIAPNASLVSMKVLAADGSGWGSDTLAALDHIVAHLPDVRVVNMSLGFQQFSAGACDYDDGFTMLLARAVDALRAREPGTLPLAASGNDGKSDAIGLPACIANAVAVGAVWDADVGGVSLGACSDYSTRADQIGCFTNSAPNLDLLAPGGLIVASGVGGGVSTMVGTSQAAPHASGAAALLIESRPSLTPDQIETALKGSGQSVTDERNGLTFTRIDALGAWYLLP